MPLYAYRCESCGFAKDVLQKISDPLLTDCPACGEARFQKQLTAAGFQLKGSGWYVTDFRDGNGSKPAPAGDAAPAGDVKTSAAADAAAATPSSTSAASPVTGSAGASASAPAAAAAPSASAA